MSETHHLEYPFLFNAAVLYETKKPLVIEKVSFQGPLQVGQVLVKIHYSGICGKQIEEIQGTGGSDPYLPHMLGHEGSGVVVDTGPGVKNISPGDHVVLHWIKGSGIDATTPFYFSEGKRINAGCITTFNEYGVISENRMTAIPKESSLLESALLGCAVTTGVGVILNDAKLLPGEPVAIFGCGGVGLSAIQGASLVNAYPIIAVDRNSESLELAAKFGATHLIDTTTTNVISEIDKISSDNGVQNIIICAGNSELTEIAIHAGSFPSNVFFVGVPPEKSKIQLNPLSIHRQRNLIGSYGGGTIPNRDIPRYLYLHEKGLLKLSGLISEIVSLDQINKGIATIRSGKVGRCIVDMVNTYV